MSSNHLSIYSQQQTVSTMQHMQPTLSCRVANAPNRSRMCVVIIASKEHQDVCSFKEQSAHRAACACCCAAPHFIAATLSARLAI